MKIDRHVTALNDLVAQHPFPGYEQSLFFDESVTVFG